MIVISNLFHEFAFHLAALVLLLIDESKVKAQVKHEGALSGRAGTFPHIYGPLNVDAVYSILNLEKDDSGEFISPYELKEM